MASPLLYPSRRHASRQLILGLRCQVARVFRDTDKRRLFHGWGRLCMHAASFSGTKAASTPTTAAAREAVVRAEKKKLDATVSGIETDNEDKTTQRTRKEEGLRRKVATKAVRQPSRYHKPSTEEELERRSCLFYFLTKCGT